MKISFKQFSQALGLIEDLKMDDEVTITSGPQKGKTGYVNKVFMKDGSIDEIEVQYTDDDEEKFVTLKPNQVTKLDEAKLDEIFGIFGGKKDDKLAKAKAERERLIKQLGAAQYALRLKQKNKAMQKAGQAANASQKPARDVRSAAGARAAERDWVASLQSESLTEGKAEINALARKIAKQFSSMAGEVSLPKKFDNKKPDKTINTGLKAPAFTNKLDVYYDRDATGAVKWTYVDAYGEQFRLKGEVSPADLKAAYKISVWIGSGEPQDIGFSER